MILSGNLIRAMNIIQPFSDRLKHHYGPGLTLTHGVGPAGYDVRVEFDKDGKREHVTLEPGGFLLASTLEHFTMPPDILGIVHDKSTWARRGLALQNTVIEPGWEGYLTLEITNHAPQPINLRRGMPIAQVIFHVIAGQVTPYQGKYQNQGRGPQEAR